MTHATLDFETYSEAGYTFNETTQKWVSCVNTAPHGLGAVGASVYTEHETAEVLSLAYDIHGDGIGCRLWVPGCPLPSDIFDHIAAGGLCHAANSMFEFLVWQNIAAARMGWPPLPLSQLRCTLSKGRAVSMPGALGPLADVLQTDIRKGKDGTRLITKFCKPRNPTKHNPDKRLDPAADPVDGPKFYEYNVDDVRSESLADDKLPPLIPEELDMWKVDQQINARGVHIDRESTNKLWAFVQDQVEQMTAEVARLTGGKVKAATEVAKMKAWILEQGVALPDMTADTVAATLKRKDIPTPVRKVLEVRAVAGSASVKKLPAILRRLSRDNRLRDLFMYHGGHTGRWAGRGPQPQNLPSSGPMVVACNCGAYFAPGVGFCAFCGTHESLLPGAIEWNINAVEHCLAHIELIPILYPDDPLAAVSGCLRGLFVASEGCRLICSDYSAIEAVVLAQMAGEEWRLEVFRTHGKIYEMSASKISGVPFEDMMAHKRDTGEHHPLRKKIGKVGELASGYQGWIGAWKAFGADKFMDDEEIKDAILKWRAESPAIVAFWKGVEDAAVAACLEPWTSHRFRDLEFFMDESGALKIRLPSGRCLTYNKMQAIPDVKWGKPCHVLEFWAVESKTKQWLPHETYGGKMTENIIQAVARDLMAFAIKNLERAGYPVVIHVHDECVSDVPSGFGSVEEYERIMATMPPWAQGWPVRAAGGWEGLRYRKD